MTVRVSCPYCNTGFDLTEIPPSGRATCARCGDAFPVRGRIESPGSGAEGVRAQSPAEIGTPLRPASKRAVAIVLAMSLVGLGIGVGIHAFQDRTTPRPNPAEAAAAASTAPSQLRGLGFLPPDSNVVAGVEPSAIAAFAARTNRDPRTLLAQAGLPGPAVAALDRIGIPFARIDHVVVGIHLPDADLAELRFVLALVLREPSPDGAAFLERLKARRIVHNGKPRYDVELAGLPLKAIEVSATEWVFGWSDRDLQPAEAGGKVPLLSGLREMLEEKIPVDATAWLAIDAARWADKQSVQFLVGQFGKKEWLPVIARGQAAAASLTVGDPSRLRCFIRCADADAGASLRAYFERKAPDTSIRRGGAGEWAMLDAPTEPPYGFELFKGFLDDAGK